MALVSAIEKLAHHRPKIVNRLDEGHGGAWHGEVLKLEVTRNRRIPEKTAKGLSLPKIAHDQPLVILPQCFRQQCRWATNGTRHVKWGKCARLKHKPMDLVGGIRAHNLAPVMDALRNNVEEDSNDPATRPAKALVELPRVYIEAQDGPRCGQAGDGGITGARVWRVNGDKGKARGMGGQRTERDKG